MARSSMKKKRIAHQAKFDPHKPISQEQFGLLTDIPQQTVSKLARYSVLSPRGSFIEWSVQYDRFMKGQIFARRGWEGLAAIYE